MGTSPDHLRTQADVTRENLSRNVDALADKVSPSAIVGRSKASVRTRFARVRDAVMGTAEQATSTTREVTRSAMQGVAETGSSMTDAVQQAPHQLERTAQGSPLAAGLVAFGAGVIVSALFPASQPEQQTATRLKESTAPALSEIGDRARAAAMDAKDELQPAAKDAAARIKETASGAADETAQQARQGTKDVSEHARGAASSTAGETRARAQRVRTEAGAERHTDT